jgi:hypothetical protein
MFHLMKTEYFTGNAAYSIRAYSTLAGEMKDTAVGRRLLT